jgi:hypothetical protein
LARVSNHMVNLSLNVEPSCERAEGKIPEIEVQLPAYIRSCRDMSENVGIGICENCRPRAVRMVFFPFDAGSYGDRLGRIVVSVAIYLLSQ